jgi:hypothetical protein
MSIFLVSDYRTARKDRKDRERALYVEVKLLSETVFSTHSHGFSCMGVYIISEF